MADFTAPSSGGSLVWRRFRRERVGVAALVLLAGIVVACFALEPLLALLLGHGADTFFPPAVDPSLHAAGPLSWVPNRPLDQPAHHGRTLFVLGADGPLGRDEFLRLLAGGRISLELAAVATTIALVIGATLGALAGWFGGAIDAVVGRMTELTMAFPILLLVIAIGQTIAVRLESVTVGGLFQHGVVALSVVIGFFSWFYPARVVRALTQSLREYEFVEAARMTGSGEARIIRKHVFPHLVGPLIVWATLVAAGVIVLEAALSILNFGLKLGTASWGSLLTDSWGSLLVFNPNASAPQYPRSGWLMLWPSLTLFLTVLSLALVGDAVRNALDPHGEG
ncbi:MAG: peptide/nickel transport system permease protein [Gaiellaceae bacterium]|nr:peptide/nickel transport system permease protein [Gaiellaceae bacterium]